MARPARSGICPVWGGPAESAFATLVGLELRPRRLREAAAMWRAVTDAVGAEKRDALWSQPDLIPTSDDIDFPAALIARSQSVRMSSSPRPWVSATTWPDGAMMQLWASMSTPSSGPALPEAATQIPF